MAKQVSTPVSPVVVACIEALKGAVCGAGKASADIARYALTLVVVHKQAVDDVCDAIRDAGAESGVSSVGVYCSQFKRIIASGKAAAIHADLEAADAWVSFGVIINGYDLAKVTKRGAKAKGKATAADAKGDPINPVKPERGVPRLAQWVQIIGDIVAHLSEESPDMEAQDLLRKAQVKLGAILADAKAKAKAAK